MLVNASSVKLILTLQVVWVVWVAIDTNQGEVLFAWCSCTTGFSQSCNHVMALLYKIEHTVSTRYTNPSCTSVPCRWNDCTLREVEL